MRKYELIPTDGHKSFYGKAVIRVDDDGAETLTSYRTDVIRRSASGDLVRLWDDWSATTGRHIRAFCGLNKAGFLALPMEETKTGGTAGRTLTNAESYAAMLARRAAG